MRELRIIGLLSRVEGVAALDPLIDRIVGSVNAVVRPRAVRDVLHGVPIGHPLHPAVVLLPLGSWISASLLDLVPGTERSARLLVAAGLVGTLPASLTGFTDWAELHEQQKRVGLLHSAANVAASGLYLASFLRRTPGSGRGKLLALLGLAVVSGSALVGGHLSFRQASGANHTEHVPHLFPEGWQRLVELDALVVDQPTQVEVSGQPLLVVRSGDGVEVLSDVCSHLSGPLSEGRLVGTGADACIECPWHESRFLLATGEVVHGPATAPQPRFDTRVVDGLVEVCLPGAG